MYITTIKDAVVNFGGYKCFIGVNTYCNNNRLALTLEASENQVVISDEVYEGEPIATVTMNLVEVSLGDGEFFIKDYSENAGMIKAVLASGVVEPTGRIARTILGTLPIFCLTEKYSNLFPS